MASTIASRFEIAEIKTARIDTKIHRSYLKSKLLQIVRDRI